MEDRAKKMEKKRKLEFDQGGVRRGHFQAQSGPGDVLNFGKNAGWKFADVYVGVGFG